MTVTPPVLVGDVDPPRPVRAIAGNLALRGWCFAPGRAGALNVQLTAPAFTLSGMAGLDRPDVAQGHPAESAAARSGFEIAGPIAPGIHLARLEARWPDGPWLLLRTLCIAAEAPALATGIDFPTASPVTARVHVEGWALQPGATIAALTLRYGHQEIACEPGRPRTDIPAAFPKEPLAAQAGFKSKLILSAGRGALRIKAQLADGTVRIARTRLDIAIPTDENVGPEIDLAGSRLALPRVTPVSPDKTAAPATKSLNVLFVLYGSFTSNSALHVAALADELAGQGHACAVAVPHDAETISHFRNPQFRAVSFAEAEKGVAYPNGLGPDLIHAWTTRENVRILTLALRERYRAKVVVHLEDNEQQLLATKLGRSTAELGGLPAEELDRLVPADLSHPTRSREFLALADGVTVITDSLRDFVPDGQRCLVVPPAADRRYFFEQSQPAEFRRAFLRRPGETVLFYHGNVHATNAAEMRELYLAVLRLNEAGHPVTLLRTGRDTVIFLGDLAGRVAPHVVSLGEILHHHHLPPLMALADIFVQPGRDDAFNRYRLPSKLPEFFALGRPVILPRTNLGTIVRHGIDAYVVDCADADAITAAVIALRQDPALCERLARGAAAFAREHFSWARTAGALAKFYAGLTT